jgi:8-oxo-dGTP pyrophosphatase MutT (NUDIX family)
MQSPPFRTIDHRIVYTTPWFQVERHEVEKASDGHRFTYSYLASSPSVMVIAVTSERQIVLVRQFRFPAREHAFELPGGGSGKQGPSEAATRELREETGYSAGRLTRLGTFSVYCGLSDEVCHVFLAEDLVEGQQALDQTEHITVHEVGYAELKRMIGTGEFRDGMGLAALQIAMPRLESLLTPHQTAD